MATKFTSHFLSMDNFICLQGVGDNHVMDQNPVYNIESQIVLIWFAGFSVNLQDITLPSTPPQTNPDSPNILRTNIMYIILWDPCQYWALSVVVQIITCCLMAPSHYLNEFSSTNYHPWSPDTVTTGTSAINENDLPSFKFKAWQGQTNTMGQLTTPYLSSWKISSLNVMPT